MAKKAFLVMASVMTRVVVDVGNDFNGEIPYGCALEEEIINRALPRLSENLCGDNIEEIIEDLECPYDEKFDK